MADDDNKRVLADLTANPAPLGFMAFGLTTVLFNLHNAGLYELNSMILAMGILYGGVAQVFVSWMEWKKGNTFGTIAFGSYGLFWITIAGLVLMPKLTFISGAADLAASETSMGWFFFAWFLFTAIMFGGALRINRALQVALFTLAVLLLFLVFRDWAGGAASADTLLGVSGTSWGKVAGWVGLIPGLTAVYIAVALVWNELYGRVILPIGPYQKKS
jgi:succinate-acetate transporter protein